jgi:hypothetical protein
VGARAGAGGRASLPTPRATDPRAREAPAQARELAGGLAGGTVHLARARAFCAFVTHNTLHSHIAYTRTLYISHLTNVKPSHTNTERNSPAHTGMLTKRVHTRETQFLPLCYAVRPTVTPRKVPEPHGRPWQPMAAAARLAARGAWRVHGASHRAMARGARHVARGTWVGGWYVHGTLSRVSSSLSSG